MTDTDSDDDEIILCCDKADEIARAVKGQVDPLPDVPPSLLSAKDIEKYVQKTGLISPFIKRKDKDSRLKKASYEGRIGSVAYMYNHKNELVSLPFIDDTLKVPANSIVFIECDLEFRLPYYIALRFNLQIRHVHRGLLLGTGPLVDPGFWGKLCIPLHNLTSEDYVIPRKKGLIWVEFTKATVPRNTLPNNEGRDPFDGEEYWNIKKFLEKASRQFDTSKIPIGIKSSIPSAFEESSDALKKSKRAQKVATRMSIIGFLTGLAVVIGVFTLWEAYYAGITTQYNILHSRLDSLDDDISKNKSNIEANIDSKVSTFDIIKFQELMRNVENNIATLEKESKLLTEKYEFLYRQLLDLQKN